MVDIRIYEHFPFIKWGI